MTLREGLELECPHCGEWHPLVERYKVQQPGGPHYLYWECAGDLYFAGSLGTDGGRYPLREAVTHGSR